MADKNWIEFGLSKEDEALVRRGAELYRATVLEAFDNVFVIARAINVLQKHNYGKGVQGGFARALIQYGYTTLDGLAPIDKSIRNSYKELLDNETAVRAWWQTEVPAEKKQTWLSARAIHRNWKAYAFPKPKTPKPPKRQLPTQPLTEGELRAHSSMKPSAQHIEKAAKKQAAEAEAEAKKLSTVEAEADKLRERIRLAEFAVQTRDSEIEELKAARTVRTVPPEPRDWLTALDAALCALAQLDMWPDTLSTPRLKKRATKVLADMRNGLLVLTDIATPKPQEELPKKKRGKAKALAEKDADTL
jgi:hypothetical protein